VSVTVVIGAKLLIFMPIGIAVGVAVNVIFIELVGVGE